MSFFFHVKEIYTLPSLPMSPWQLSCKESTSNAGEVGLIPFLERSPGEGNDNLLQYSCLGNLMDRGAWWTTVHGATNESEYDLVAKQQHPDQCLISSDFPILSIGTCVAVIHYSSFILHFFISNKVKPLILHHHPLKLLFFWYAFSIFFHFSFELSFPFDL